MNANTPHQKQYSSATQRLLKPQIEHFFVEEFPKMFGPVIRARIADSLLELFTRQVRQTTSLEPGQILWNAVDVATRADAPNRRFVPVVLTMVNEQDIQNRTKGLSIVEIRAQSTARILREAYQQGALLSMRDITLLCWQPMSMPSRWRKYYEQTHQCELPHPGNLQDMGSCITHKDQIVYKAIVEKKDPIQVANESRHTQQAVDRYLKDFHRVQTVYNHNPDPDYISLVTNISKSVVNQYINLIETHDISDK
ncbi:MAG TPA: DUF1670 domain-containing protein [Balneolaceae bacterium]|nr:DUF1670 domain-containing protein [Balneolaceae bacterium]